MWQEVNRKLCSIATAASSPALQRIQLVLLLPGICVFVCTSKQANNCAVPQNLAAEYDLVPSTSPVSERMPGVIVSAACILDKYSVWHIGGHADQVTSPKAADSKCWPKATQRREMRVTRRHEVATIQ